MSVERIVETVAGAAPAIRAGLSGRREYDDEENPSGEQQLAADVYADRLLEERLLALDSVAAYASEEREEVVAGDGGEYHVALDPLDGSSNLKSNNAMGTILGVYDEPLPARGRALVAAGYVLYGPITTMMVAVDGEVTEYVIEESETRSASGMASSAVRRAEDLSDAGDAGGRGEGTGPQGAQRYVATEDVTLPDDPTVYGFGGRAPDWPDAFEAYVEEIEAERLKLRYGGAMIADVNQVMTYGGVFGYPALADAPEGKLRLQFEANPMAYVVESAGGRSSDGERSLLDVDPGGLHQRVPVHLGNAGLVDRLEDALA